MNRGEKRKQIKSRIVPIVPQEPQEDSSFRRTIRNGLAKIEALRTPQLLRRPPPFPLKHYTNIFLNLPLPTCTPSSEENKPKTKILPNLVTSTPHCGHFNRFSTGSSVGSPIQLEPESERKAAQSRERTGDSSIIYIGTEQYQEAVRSPKESSCSSPTKTAAKATSAIPVRRGRSAERKRHQQSKNSSNQENERSRFSERLRSRSRKEESLSVAPSSSNEEGQPQGDIATRGEGKRTPTGQDNSSSKRSRSKSLKDEVLSAIPSSANKKVQPQVDIAVRGEVGRRTSTGQDKSPQVVLTTRRSSRSATRKGSTAPDEECVPSQDTTNTLKPKSHVNRIDTSLGSSRNGKLNGSDKDGELSREIRAVITKASAVKKSTKDAHTSPLEPPRVTEAPCQSSPAKLFANKGSVAENPKGVECETQTSTNVSPMMSPDLPEEVSAAPPNLPIVDREIAASTAAKPSAGVPEAKVNFSRDQRKEFVFNKLMSYVERIAQSELDNGENASDSSDVNSTATSLASSSSNRRFKKPQRTPPSVNDFYEFNREGGRKSGTPARPSLEAIVDRLKSRRTANKVVQTSMASDSQVCGAVFRRSAIKAKGGKQSEPNSVRVSSNNQSSRNLNIFDSVEEGNPAECLLFSALYDDDSLERPDKPWRLDWCNLPLSNNNLTSGLSFIKSESDIQRERLLNVSEDSDSDQTLTNCSPLKSVGNQLGYGRKRPGAEGSAKKRGVTQIDDDTSETETENGPKIKKVSDANKKKSRRNVLSQAQKSRDLGGSVKKLKKLAVDDFSVDESAEEPQVSKVTDTTTKQVGKCLKTQKSQNLMGERETENSSEQELVVSKVPPRKKPASNAKRHGKRIHDVLNMLTRRQRERKALASRGFNSNDFGGTSNSGETTERYKKTANKDVDLRETAESQDESEVSPKEHSVTERNRNSPDGLKKKSPAATPNKTREEEETSQSDDESAVAKRPVIEEDRNTRKLRNNPVKPQLEQAFSNEKINSKNVKEMKQTSERRDVSGATPKKNSVPVSPPSQYDSFVKSIEKQTSANKKPTRTSENQDAVEEPLSLVEQNRTSTVKKSRRDDRVKSPVKDARTSSRRLMETTLESEILEEPQFSLPVSPDRRCSSPAKSIAKQTSATEQTAENRDAIEESRSLAERTRKSTVRKSRRKGRVKSTLGQSSPRRNKTPKAALENELNDASAHHDAHNLMTVNRNEETHNQAEQLLPDDDQLEEQPPKSTRSKMKKVPVKRRAADLSKTDKKKRHTRSKSVAGRPRSEVNETNIIPSEDGGRPRRKRVETSKLWLDVMEKIGVVPLEDRKIRYSQNGNVKRRSRKTRSKANDGNNMDRPPEVALQPLIEEPAAEGDDVSNVQGRNTSSEAMPPPSSSGIVALRKLSVMLTRMDDVTADSGFENSYPKKRKLPASSTKAGKRKTKGRPTSQLPGHVDGSTQPDHVFDETDTAAPNTSNGWPPSLNDQEFETNLVSARRFALGEEPPLSAYVETQDNMLVYECSRKETGYIRVKPGVETAKIVHKEHMITLMVCVGSCIVKVEDTTLNASSGEFRCIPKRATYSILNGSKEEDLVLCFIKNPVNL